CLDMKVQGYVVPEFIDAKKAYIKYFENGGEVGSSVAAYYNSKLVVDLQGRYANLEAKYEYNKNIIQFVFSSTKIMGGVNFLATQLTKSDFENLDKLANILAIQLHYLMEVDPKHRTIGQIITKEISTQYNLEFYLLLLPNILPRNKKISISFILNLLDQDDLMIKTFNHTFPGLPNIFELGEVTKFEVFKFEGSSVIKFTNTKLIAKLGAIITNNRQPLNDNDNSRPLLSKNTIDLISTKLLIAWDHIFKENVTYLISGFLYIRFPGIENVEFLELREVGRSIFI
ncbi:11315_t:CDS:2, partial [Dentiscutata erythropus]